jgi:hypothetical protein
VTTAAAVVVVVVVVVVPDNEPEVATGAQLRGGLKACGSRGIIIGFDPGTIMAFQ